MHMRKMCLLGLCVFLTGCQTALPFPKIKQSDTPITVEPHVSQSPIIFTKTAINIPVGQVVAAYPYWRFSLPNVNLGLYSCNIGLSKRLSHSTATWDIVNADWESWKVKANEFVEPALMEMGYDVVSTRDIMFNQAKVTKRAELELGASVTDLKLNLCHFYSGWDWKASGQSAGTAYIKVKWEIYDPLRRKVIKIIETQGTSQQDDAMQNGEQILILKALKSATRRLGETRDFYNVMTGKTDPEEPDTKFATLTIPAQKISKKPMEEMYNLLKRAVITIRTTTGYGSGFFISDTGYALTDAQVVGEAKTVAIVDSAGVQYMADVVRVAESAGVALIKAHLNANAVLPIQTDKNPAPASDIYVMGTPVSESYKATLTKGIFSGWHSYRGLRLIQASVDISKGSEGGPLLDKYGNVLGITAQGTNTSTYLALFIPIKEALKALNIRLK